MIFNATNLLLHFRSMRSTLALRLCACALVYLHLLTYAYTFIVCLQLNVTSLHLILVNLCKFLFLLIKLQISWLIVSHFSLISIKKIQLLFTYSKQHVFVCISHLLTLTALAHCACYALRSLALFYYFLVNFRSAAPNAYFASCSQFINAHVFCDARCALSLCRYAFAVSKSSLTNYY